MAGWKIKERGLSARGNFFQGQANGLTNKKLSNIKEKKKKKKKQQKTKERKETYFVRRQLFVVFSF